MTEILDDLHVMDVNDSILVSIAMPVWNGQDTLYSAIRSLILQTHSNWELILIDDGSTDGTVEIARSFDDKRIRIFSDSLRLGLAARLNQAIDLCRGQYFARLDADDIAYPERLAIQVAYLKNNPDVDLVGSSGIVFSNNGQAIGLLPIDESHSDICRKPWSGFYLGHPTWMGKIMWFKTVRYNSVALKAQDLDLLLRTYKTSRFAGLSQMLIGYRQDSISIRKLIITRYYVSRALLRSKREIGLIYLIWGMFGQFVKAVVDVVAFVTGLDQILLNHRAYPTIPVNELEKWKQVFDVCNRGRK